MDLWQRAREFAEEAAKRSQELTDGAARLSLEATRKAKELAAEASKRADQIKSLAGEIPLPIAPPPRPSPEPSQELDELGISEDLREFTKGITLSTFRDFPLQDEPEESEVPTASNVRQDLNEWQARHATLVLSTVKEISKLRYELCPRFMKERKFWRIYFILVNSYTSLFEKKYLEELKSKQSEDNSNGRLNESSSHTLVPKNEEKEAKLQGKTSTAEQDLDTFLLGDFGSDDEGADDRDDEFEDDFDKIENSGLESGGDDDDDARKTTQTKNAGAS